MHAVVRTCSGKGAKMSRGKSHATELCASEGRSVFARCGILSRGQFGARSTTSPQSRKRLLVSRGVLHAITRRTRTLQRRYLRLDFLVQLLFGFLILRSRVPSPFKLPQPGDFIAQLLRHCRVHFKTVTIAGSSHGRRGPVRFSRMNVRLRRESHFDPKSGRRFGMPHHA